MTVKKNSFSSRGTTFRGTKEFFVVQDDYDYFVYGEDIYDIRDFKKYLLLNLDDTDIAPVCTVDEFEGINFDSREYFNTHNLYGPGEDIVLIQKESAAILVTNMKGF